VVFKASDFRVSPFELESVLIEPRPRWSRRRTRCGWPCRERVAPYKRIRRIECADLPKTISGKIRRVELRGQENAPRESVRGVTEFWKEDFTW
jgi:acetyl-CoA synthetase